MGKGIFITGTDTGIGKTLIACGLAAFLRSLDYSVGVLKPVETGCEEREGKLFPQDAFYLKQASGCDEPLETICRYRMREPLAPASAAIREGIRIDISLLTETYDKISRVHDITLVEGAGGLLVPLLPSYTFADLAKTLKLPLLVVAPNRLGALNHLLLTLEHASSHGLSVLGYIFNRLEKTSSPAAETNPETLRFLTAVSYLGEIPYIEDLESKRALLADLFGEKLDLQSLELILPAI